jgi:flagellar biosynthesis protein FlhB
MPGDRTEKATPRQKQKAAQRGDRARSRDLMAAAAMLAGVSAMGHEAGNWVAGWANAYRVFLRLGQAIPPELYAAVAGILAWLYRREVEQRMERERARAAERMKEARAT